MINVKFVVRAFAKSKKCKNIKRINIVFALISAHQSTVTAHDV